MSSDGQLPATPDEELPDLDERKPQTRVAIDVLQHDQRAILFEGDPDRTPPLRPLVDGFGSLREAINWWQAASVRTFGHLDDHMGASALAGDAALRDALLDADSGAATRRHRHLQRVIDACERAHRQLESQANEWLGEGSSGDTDHQRVDVDRQRHVAMRPAFSRLDEAQARCLVDLWGGFADRPAVMEWAHQLPAVAEFDRYGRGVSSQLGRSAHAMAMLTGTGDRAARWRDRFAATWLLPAFARRATRLRGQEQPRSEADENPWNEV